jgi:short-chain fatty acids transporter
MLRALSNFFVTFLNRWMPDSFVVAIILSLFTFVMAITVADFPVAAATQAWGDSIWDLLRFTNQIVLTLLLGHVLAHTPPVRNLLMAMAGRVASPYAAYVATTMVAFICTYISWGLGLVAGGIMARAVGESCRRNNIVIHYPLLVACAYAGFVIFHQGLTASVPLRHYSVHRNRNECLEPGHCPGHLRDPAVCDGKPGTGARRLRTAA